MRKIENYYIHKFNRLSDDDADGSIGFDHLLHMAQLVL